MTTKSCLAGSVLSLSAVMAPTRSRPYLLEFDAVGVLERRAGWTRVLFLGEEGRPVPGWLRADEVSAATP